MKLGDLKNIESVMVRVVNSEIPIRMAFQLTLFVEELDEKLTKLEEFRIKLVKKHGFTDKHGGIQVKPENMDAFTYELRDLMDTEVEIKITTIPISLFEDNEVNISVKELKALVRVGLIEKIE